MINPFNALLKEISKFCEKCPAVDKGCTEENCVLFRIEKIIIDYIERNDNISNT